MGWAKTSNLAVQLVPQKKSLVLRAVQFWHTNMRYNYLVNSFQLQWNSVF